MSGSLVEAAPRANVDRHRRFLAAMTIDAVAGGAILPATTIVLLALTDLRLPALGAALSLGGILALPAGIWGGNLVDRIGPRAVMMGSNIAQAAGVGGYLLCHTFGSVAACTFVAAGGRSIFWGSFGVAVTAISGPGDRETWFARVGGLRNVGQALGALLAGFALAFHNSTAYDLLIILTAAAFVGAVPLMRTVPSMLGSSAGASSSGSWVVVLRDRNYWPVLAHWATIAMSAHVLAVAIPAYAVVVLHLPGRVAGATFALNTLIIGIGQRGLVSRLSGMHRWAALAGAQALFAASYLMMLGAALCSGAGAIGVVMLAVIVYTLAEATAWPVGSALASEAAADHLLGRYLALNQLSVSAVGAAAPGALSGLLACGAAAVWLPMTAVCGVGAVLTRALAEKVPAASARISVQP